MDKKHVGARSELIACAWLLAEGYEVFRNVSPHGHIDIIALKDGKTFYFDVKTLQKGARHLPSQQIAQGVLPLTVTATGQCSIEWSPKSQRRRFKKRRLRPRPHTKSEFERSMIRERVLFLAWRGPGPPAPSLACLLVDRASPTRSVSRSRPRM
jgi:Holliday junction resolvase